jgi:hypothetical protein
MAQEHSEVYFLPCSRVSVALVGRIQRLEENLSSRATADRLPPYDQQRVIIPMLHKGTIKLIAKASRVENESGVGLLDVGRPGHGADSCLKASNTPKRIG